MLQEQPLNERMSPLNLQDALRQLIPGVDLFDSDDLNHLVELLSMEYSINSPEELKTRFVCAKQLIWTDEDKVDVDGCESFEFNELLIYIKEIDS
ncbi:hypothetical protein [Synechococcus sp. BIOS-E4-1]|uniref:hypothetical protein n=1 Tax=Synechococcus sp. BIOS-E4-1 TaxID=1400864 RepID=UPI001645E421|nr:hypothetical protein [Synechococcus sp. BIOS-E4-1]